MSKPDMFTKSIHRTLLDGPLQGAKRMSLPFKPTPQHPLILSASEFGDFDRCKLRWNWRYRVGLKSKKIVVPRNLGLIISHGKELWYDLAPRKRTVRAMIKIATQENRSAVAKVLTPKERDLGYAMLVGFAEWALGDHDDSDHAIGKAKAKVESEHAFCLPLTEDKTIWVRGYLDEMFIPTNKKRTLAVDETKTKATISFDMLELNAQMTMYLWAMSVEYPKYDRYVIYRTVLRRMMPGPRVKNPLFGRESVERNPEDLHMWMLDARRRARDMLDAAIYPTQTDSCKWDCDFYNLCLIRSNKADLKHTIKTEFTVA